MNYRFALLSCVCLLVLASLVACDDGGTLRENIVMEKSFMKDPRDGQIYKTVKIGEQTWMAENLNYSADDSYCFGPGDHDCFISSRLYKWHAAMNACPVGWHLPDSVEWKTLISSIGGEKRVDQVLKSSDGWNGLGNYMDCKDYVGACIFWSSTVYSESSVYSMNLSNFTDTAGLFPVTVIDQEERENRMLRRYERKRHKRLLFDLLSVRCVKDEKIDGSQVANDKNMEIKKDGDSIDVKTNLNDSRNTDSITKEIMTDPRDGQIYKTVKIGPQTWMAENLNYKTENSFCYDNVDSNCTKYGRLYVNSEGVCPVGWHLPAKWEWVKLFSVLNDSSTVGKKIKSTEGWFDDGNGTDEFGFSVLPAGLGYLLREIDGESYLRHQKAKRKIELHRRTPKGKLKIDSSKVRFVGKNRYALFFMNADTFEKDMIYLTYNNNKVDFYSGTITGASVRCLKDVEVYNAKGNFRDSRDGQTYKTVKIGEQTWMAENLRYKIKGSRQYYNRRDSIGKYGRLYNWNLAKNACPAGWHLPDTSDWNTLISTVGEGIAGKMLKSKSGWMCKDGSRMRDNHCFSAGDGSDKYGFSAYPTALRKEYLFAYKDKPYLKVSAFWSSTETNENEAYSTRLFYDHDDADPYYDNGKKEELSVRCVKGKARKRINSSRSNFYSFMQNYNDKKIVGKFGYFGKTRELILTQLNEQNAKKSYSIAKGEFTDSRDGETYKTVKIGWQTWMAENLKFKMDSSSCYQNADSNCTEFGRFYKWDAAIAACPAGWHLPDSVEWSMLIHTAGGKDSASKALKSTKGWSGHGNGTDKFGFSAVPASATFLGLDAEFWSASEKDSARSYNFGLACFFPLDCHGGDICTSGNECTLHYLSVHDEHKSSRYSVRCVKDEFFLYSGLAKFIHWFK